MDDSLRLALLFDFYGELLKENQKEVYNSFVFLDLSLSEIAEEQGISRQAVHDMVKRSVNTLEGYEKKLGLIKRYNSMTEKINEVRTLVSDETSGINGKTRDRILSALDDISELA